MFFFFEDPKIGQTLKRIGENLSLARRRRHISLKSLAERVGVSSKTISRLEQGDPTVAWGTVITVMEVLGLQKSTEHIADSAYDELGLGLMDEKVPKRIKSRSIKNETGAF
jgi:transcriptional regulator with XRE-family HTH domain